MKMKMKNNNLKLKEKKRKRKINIDLAVLPSHDISTAISQGLLCFSQDLFFLLGHLSMSVG